MNRSLAPILAVAALALSCGKPGAGAPEPTEDAATSPNASILPAPVAAPPVAEPPEAGVVVGIPADSSGRLILPSDAAPPVVPEAMRADKALDADALTQRELPGVALEGEWRYGDVPAPPKGAEVNGFAIDVAKKLTALKWQILVVEQGRMRVQFSSRALPLGQGTELRSRFDRYGHVLVWPNGDHYRTLAPGSVRTLLGERRVDAIPLVRAQGGPAVDAGHRLGLATRRLELSTRTGKLSLEQAKMPDAGDGGLLLCRLFTEIIAIDPSAAPCAAGEVPVRAQFSWPGGGGITFEVTSVAHRLDIALGEVITPPPAASFAAGAMPPNATGIFLTRDEIASLRTKALDLGPSTAPGAPGEGFIAQNSSDLLRYVFVDGVPVAWVAPNQEQYVIGTARGRYQVQWRTFLGDAVEPPRMVEFPARIVYGAAGDGGTSRDR